MNLYQKFKETAASVLPIVLIVLLLGFTVAPLERALMIRFVFGGLLVAIGLTIFLLGVDIGIIPLGERSGAALTQKKNLALLLIAAFFIGFMVTIAEPDVQVLADQVKSISPAVSKQGLIFMIAAGIGLFTALGILRTVLSLPLNITLIVCYAIVFALAFFTPSTFQGTAFDSGGATTGPMTVPFILALGLGVASVRLNKLSSASDDDSFGLTGIASIGPVAAVCVYGILISGSASSVAAAAEAEGNAAAEEAAGVFAVFLRLVPETFFEVINALAPLAALAVILQVALIKMPPFQVIRMVRGFVLSFAGLVIFLVGAGGGFMSAGEELGRVLGSGAVSSGAGKALLAATGAVFGAVVVCAEPAVWVLTEQVEDVSGGTVKRRVMLGALSCGVAISIALAMLRVLFGFSLWFILIPGYAVALILTFVSPKLFTGIAFDSGGVASGPMTSTFILSFTLGAAKARGGNPATDAFGVIALVAMTPLIAIQVLGIIFKVKSEKAKKSVAAKRRNR